MSDLLPWVALGISVLALAVNGVSWHDRRRQDQRDTFLRIHERMIDPDLQEGRRIVFERCETIDAVIQLRAESGQDYRAANRALAMFDAFGLYVEHGYVDREVAMEEWGYATANFFDASQAFLQVRAQEAGREPWSNFQSLGRSAQAWKAANQR